MTGCQAPDEVTGRAGRSSARGRAGRRRPRDGARGVTPTVEEAADAAGDLAHDGLPVLPQPAGAARRRPPGDRRPSPCSPTDPPDGPRGAAGRGRRAFTRLIVETEAQQRTMLRLSLEPTTPTARHCRCARAGRSAGSTKPSRPLRDQLSDGELHQLVLAIRSATGIEALVWLTDVAGLPATRRSSSCAGRPRRCCSRPHRRAPTAGRGIGHSGSLSAGPPTW